MTPDSRHNARHLVPILVLWTARAAVVHAGEPHASARRLPEWDEGDWWVVSSDYLIGSANNPETPGKFVYAGEAPELSVFSVQFRFMVGRRLGIGGQMCDVLEVFPHKLPQNVRDDTRGHPLWRLFVRECDGTLARYEWKLRGGPCNVAGDVEEAGATSYAEHLPVVNAVYGLVPLDVPFLPTSIDRIRPPHRRHSKTSSQDQRAEKKRRQTIGVYEDIVFGKRQKVVAITIWGPYIGSRMQLWVPGYPWWVE